MIWWRPAVRDIIKQFASDQSVILAWRLGSVNALNQHYLNILKRQQTSLRMGRKQCHRSQQGPSPKNELDEISYDTLAGSGMVMEGGVKKGVAGAVTVVFTETVI